MQKFDIFAQLHKNLIVMITVVAAIFITSQFVVMATVQTRGADIGYLRREQENFRLENEKLRADINAAKTEDRIMGELKDKFPIEQMKATILEKTDPKSTSQK